MGNLFSKFFGTVRSDRFYPGNAGDVFLVNLDCVHAWNFSGTCAGADEISRKKLVVRVNRTLMGAPPVVIGLLTYMLLRKKGPFGALRWVFTIKGMVTAQVLIITRSSVEWYIHMRSARRLRSGRLPGRWELTGIRPRGFCCVK